MPQQINEATKIAMMVRNGLDLINLYLSQSIYKSFAATAIIR